MHSISDVEERIAQLRAEMKPLQELYGLENKTIEQRYQEIQARKNAAKTIPKPKFKLPKL
jgi:hypothetical protein